MNPKLAPILCALGISEDCVVRRKLCPHDEPDVLTIAEFSADGREHRLTPEAAQAWHSLQSAAHADGVSLFLVSAFRGVERQAEIIRRKLDAGIQLDLILLASAPPGFSEHHTGRAIDLGCDDCKVLDIAFAQTTAYSWLCKHAHDFGFHLSYPEGNPEGYQFEPWHWCFQPTGRNPMPSRGS